MKKPMPDSATTWSRDRTSDYVHTHEALFEHLREGVVIANNEGRIVQVNPAFCRLTGYALHEVLGQRLRPHPALQPAQGLRQMLRMLAQEDQWSGECMGLNKDGRQYSSNLMVRIVRDSYRQIQNYLVLLSDFSWMNEQQRRLERIAHYDSLTKLPNRTLLYERMDRALLQGARHRHHVAVVFIDMDNFKPVNDNHGHAWGDQLLQAIGARLKGALRESDTLARFGGDEFVALLPRLDQPSDCLPVLYRLMQAAREPFTLREFEIRLSVSIGVMVAAPGTSNGTELIQHADAAMYQAKRAGGDRFCFSELSA